MSIIKSILTGIALAAVGYGARKGAQYLIDSSDASNGDHGDGVDAIIEKARALAEAEFSDMGLNEGAVS